jgi:hypothetical protein
MRRAEREFCNTTYSVSILPHASAPLDAQVFFVSHYLCTCANPSNFRVCISFWLLGTTQLDYYSTVYW